MEVKKKREFKPKFNEELLGDNPFSLQLQIPVNIKEFHNQYKKDKDGDLVPVFSELEADKACKVYIDSERRLRTNKLSPRAKELLMWLFYEVKAGQDYLWLNRVRYMSENNISSPNTYRSALNELITNGFITRTVVNAVYWINPSIFFNGSRIAKYPMRIIHK